MLGGVVRLEAINRRRQRGESRKKVAKEEVYVKPTRVYLLHYCVEYNFLPVAQNELTTNAAGVAALQACGAAKGLAQSKKKKCERIISQEAEAVVACRPTLRAAAGVSGWSL
jgi:hypothetical protein